MNKKRKMEPQPEAEPVRKRIKPTLLSTLVQAPPKLNEFELPLDPFVEPEPEVAAAADPKPGSSRSATESPAVAAAAQGKVNEVFMELLKVCREADESPDMERLLTNKLLKYYHEVHPDYVNSKSFMKDVRTTTLNIRNNSKLVYYSLQSIVAELNTRRKAGSAIMVNEDTNLSPEDQKLNRKLKKLNQALVHCSKKIREFEEADVNFDEEVNSSHLLAERYKDRACKIYEKICDLTGESRHAHRAVRKPIRFSETSYIEFNKAVQAFVNKTLKFPDFMDILKIMQHCNTQFDYGLRADDQKRIAQTAFQGLGGLLQKRRRLDLYETVEHFTNHQRDPASEDAALTAKLEANKKVYAKLIDEVINK